MIAEVVVLIFLAWNSRRDLKEREVSLRSVGVAGIVGVLYQFFYLGNYGMPLVGMLPGVCLIVLSGASRQAIGMGDGLAVLVLGIWMGWLEAFEMLMYGLLLAAGYSGILLLVKKKGRTYEIPFVPFLLLGYVGRLLLWEM